MNHKSSPAWHQRFVVRTTVTLAAVALGSATLVGLPLYGLAQDLLERTLDERLEGTAELAVLALPEGVARGGEGVGRALAVLQEEADLEVVCLYSPEGALLGGTDARACALNPEGQDALRRAQEEDAVVMPSRADGAGEPYALAFAPVGEGRGPRPVLGIRASAAWLARLGDLRVIFGVAGLIGVGLVALLGRWSAGRLVRPLEGLARATEALGAGLREGPDEGAPLGDTVEIQALQQAFSAMQASVRGRETALRALAGSVAHEVRNPSNALRLHLGLLRRDLGEVNPSTRRRLDVLQEQLDQLDATVDDFLLLTRERRLNLEEVELAELLERASEGASVEAPAGTVRVNAVLLGRAVCNLVRNAQQAGGEPVRVRAEVAEGRLRIQVSDHGPGLPPEIAERAFEPFVTGRRDGSGLGLAIVSAIAAGHGGVARIVHTGPQGTTFELDLPAP